MWTFARLIVPSITCKIDWFIELQEADDICILSLVNHVSAVNTQQQNLFNANNLPPEIHKLTLSLYRWLLREHHVYSWQHNLLSNYTVCIFNEMFTFGRRKNMWANLVFVSVQLEGEYPINDNESDKIVIVLRYSYKQVYFMSHMKNLLTPKGFIGQVYQQN